MKYLKFTYVDAVTGVSVLDALAKNGPKFPAVGGLEFVWARKTQYPTDTPEFFGTCPDDSLTTLDGVIDVLSREDFDAMKAAEIALRVQRLKSGVIEKREQVEEGGTTVNGMPVATDSGSQARLTGALNFVGRNNARVIKWRGADGKHVSINKSTIEAMSDAIGEFVAKCFDAEAAHFAAIDAMTDLAEVDGYDINAGWQE